MIVRESLQLLPGTWAPLFLVLSIIQRCRQGDEGAQKQRRVNHRSLGHYSGKKKRGVYQPWPHLSPVPTQQTHNTPSPARRREGAQSQGRFADSRD